MTIFNKVILLQSKLELTAHELVLYRNKLAGTQKEYEHWRTTLHQILMESLPENTYLGKFHTLPVTLK